MEKKKRFFKDVFWYTGANFLANIINFITGIAIRKILEPFFMGIFNQVMLFFDYSRHYHLGILHALDKELPVSYGMKDFKRFESIKNIGFTLCFFIIAALSSSMFIYSFFIKTAIVAKGVRIVSLLAIIQAFTSIFIVFNRSQNRYIIISKYVILVAILDLIVKTVLTFRFGLFGLIWASFLTFSAGLIYFYKKSKAGFKILKTLPLDEISKLLKIGFPLFIVGFIFLIIRSIDRIMIIRFLNAESLGFYTIALMAVSYTVQIPAMISAVIFPRFYQAFGEKRNIKDIKDIFIKPNIVFAYLFPIVIGLLILILPLPVKYILPKYMPGIIAANALLLGAFFLSFVEMPGYLLTVLDRQSHMVIIGSFSVLIGIILIKFFIVNLAMGILGVAIATGITYFIFSTALICYAYKHYTKKIFSHLKLFTELYLPFVWVVFILIILRAFSFKSSGILLSDITMILFKSILFLFACIPLLFYVNRKTEVLVLLKSSCCDFFKRRIKK